jgi:hypothetical protein
LGALLFGVFVIAAVIAMTRWLVHRIAFGGTFLHRLAGPDTAPPLSLLHPRAICDYI